MTIEPSEILAAAATLHHLADATGAQRMVALLDLGEEGAAIVDCAAGRSVTALLQGEEGEVALPDDFGGAEPLVEPHVHALGAIAVRVQEGEVVAPMGAVAQVAAAVRDVAFALGGRTAVTAEFTTADPETPFAVAARPGEPVILAIGEEPFEMPEGWPGPGPGADGRVA